MNILILLKRIEHSYSSPKRKPGSGKIAKKLTRNKINKLVKAFNHNDKIGQRQAAKKFECSQLMVLKVFKQNNIQLRHKTGKNREAKTNGQKFIPHSNTLRVD